MVKLENGFEARIVKLKDEEIQRFVQFHKNKTKKILFLRYIVSVKGLYSKRGVQLCSTNIAAALGISNQSVLNYIKQLQDHFVLECTDAKFKVGAKSRMYKGTCSELFKLFNKYCNEKKGKKWKRIGRFLEKDLLMQKVRKKVFAKINASNAKKLNNHMVKQICRVYVGSHHTMVEDVLTYLDARFLDYDFKRHKKVCKLDVEPANIAFGSKAITLDTAATKTMGFYYFLKAIYQAKGMVVKFKKEDVFKIFRKFHLRRLAIANPTYIRSLLGKEKFNNILKESLNAYEEVFNIRKFENGRISILPTA